MRTGEVSVVTPFRYSRMLFGILLGVIVFGEQLSNSMIVGSTMIIASGLFVALFSKSVTELDADDVLVITPEVAPETRTGCEGVSR